MTCRLATELSRGAVVLSSSWLSLQVLGHCVYVEEKDGEQDASSDEFTGCCVRYLFLNKGEYEHESDP